jgi:chitin synthase
MMQPITHTETRRRDRFPTEIPRILATYLNESNDTLLPTQTSPNGTQYYDANAQHEAGGLRTSDVGAAPEYSEADEGG